MFNSKVIKGLKSYWRSLSPSKQKWAVRGFAMFCFVLFVLTSYWIQHPKKVTKRERRKTEVVKFETPEFLEKSFVLEQRKKMKSIEERIDELNRLLAEKKKREAEEAKGKVQESALKGRVSSGKAELKPVVSLQPQPVAATAETGPKVLRKPYRSVTSEQVIGGIDYTHVSVKKSESVKKKKSQVIYLPPSFMEATLLSGLYAPTMAQAEKEPLPILFRVKNLAVLPNRVKMDLKGCFVIGEGYGVLSDERVHIRLVTLSCIARNGRSVVVERVKGYVQDQDGGVGLRGRVVTKMGAFLARAVLASFLEGFGTAYEEQAYTTYTGTWGETRTLKPSRAFQSGFAKGVGEAAKRLSDFFMRLANETFPVIEIGVLRDVTIVITKGVELHLKNYTTVENGAEDLLASSLSNSPSNIIGGEDAWWAR